MLLPEGLHLSADLYPPICNPDNSWHVNYWDPQKGWLGQLSMCKRQPKVKAELYDKVHLLHDSTLYRLET